MRGKFVLEHLDWRSPLRWYIVCIVHNGKLHNFPLLSQHNFHFHLNFGLFGTATAMYYVIENLYNFYVSWMMRFNDEIRNEAFPVGLFSLALCIYMCVCVSLITLTPDLISPIYAQLQMHIHTRMFALNLSSIAQFCE